MVIEADTRDVRRRLDRLRKFLSVAFAVSVLPLLFDPISINLTLLAVAFNTVVWLTWLLDTIGRLRDLQLDDRQDRTG